MRAEQGDIVQSMNSVCVPAIFPVIASRRMRTIISADRASGEAPPPSGSLFGSLLGSEASPPAVAPPVPALSPPVPADGAPPVPNCCRRCR
jgi:hypothetical protein